MIARDATLPDLEHVCRNLSAHSATEVFAGRWHEDPDRLVDELWLRKGQAIAHYALCPDDGPPAALVGAWMVAPAVAVVGLIGTPQWLTIARDAYRFLKGEFVPRVLVPNVRLAECAALADGPDRAFLRRLGMIELLPALPRGKNGELFVQMAWINPKVAP